MSTYELTNKSSLASGTLNHGLFSKHLRRHKTVREWLKNGFYFLDHTVSAEMMVWFANRSVGDNPINKFNRFVGLYFYRRAKLTFYLTRETL